MDDDVSKISSEESCFHMYYSLCLFSCELFMMKVCRCTVLA